MRNFRATFAVLFLVLCVLVLLPIQWLAIKLKLPARRTMPMRFHRVLCRGLGFRIHIKGEIADGHGLLIISNHVSWLDVPLISNVAPLSFVAKAQVGTWPVFGMLSKLQRTVYVDRDRRSSTAEQRDRLKARLEEGDTLVLFPEGSSFDGNEVRPFKSSLLSVAEGTIRDPVDGRQRPILVQPMTIAYTHLHGMPMGREFRPFFAWYGDMDLMPHLWEAFGLGPIDVTIELHKPMTIEECGSRKELGRRAHAIIQQALARNLAGVPQKTAHAPVPDAALEAA